MDSQTIKQKVQANMAQLDNDCVAVEEKLRESAVAEAAKSKKKATWTTYRVLLWALLPIIGSLAALDSYHHLFKKLPAAVRKLLACIATVAL